MASMKYDSQKTIKAPQCHTDSQETVTTPQSHPMTGGRELFSLNETELEDKLAQLDQELKALALERDRCGLGSQGFKTMGMKIDETLKQQKQYQEDLNEIRGNHTMSLEISGGEPECKPRVEGLEARIKLFEISIIEQRNLRRKAMDEANLEVVHAAQVELHSLKKHKNQLWEQWSMLLGAKYFGKRPVSEDLDMACVEDLHDAMECGSEDSVPESDPLLAEPSEYDASSSQRRRAVTL